ncbi:MAG: hypothetical protein KAI17_27685, partial [Thiotrichaceae bacterium]|nr:hypothetical protein [Thiotrichaceae bacterium]
MIKLPHVIIIFLSTLISACIGTSENTQSEAVSSNFSITTTEGETQQRLACNQGDAKTLCNLRIYQVMVESFIDGDSAHDYNSGYGTSHHKGDLQGIIDSLDYIQALGMNAIWMTPIFNTIERPLQSVWE